MYFKKLRNAITNVMPLAYARNSLALPMFKKIPADNRKIVPSKYKQIYIIFENDPNALYPTLLSFFGKFPPKMRNYSERPISFWEYVFYQPYLYVLPKNQIIIYRMSINLGRDGNNNNRISSDYSINIHYSISSDIQEETLLNEILHIDKRLKYFINNDINIQTIIDSNWEFKNGMDIYSLIKEDYEKYFLSKVVIIKNCFLFLEKDDEIYRGKPLNH